MNARTTVPIRRRCARILPVDPDDRLLLFFSSGFVAPGVEYYVTVGGGVHAGESLAEAAARELHEETGLRVAAGDLGPVVGRAEGRWSDRPGETVHQEDHYFFLRVPRFEVRRDGLEPIESRELTEARWLAVEEVRVADPIVFPALVSDLLTDLIAGAIPREPVDLPWRAWSFDPQRDWTVTDRFGILGQ